MPIFATYKVMLALQLGELLTFWRTPPHRFLVGWLMFPPLLFFSSLVNKNARLAVVLEILGRMEKDGTLDLTPQWSQRIVDRTVGKYLAELERKESR